MNPVTPKAPEIFFAMNTERKYIHKIKENHLALLNGIKNSYKVLWIKLLKL